MRQLFAAACVLILSTAASPALAQRIAPSVYVGVGNFTNLGGNVGLGTELRIGEYVSVNAAVGYLVEDSNLESDGARRDFDVGAKVYPFRTWLFLGLNYGLVDYWLDDRVSPAPIHRTHAFSFTVGARTPAWRGLYASAFLGTTSDDDANRFFDSSSPRVGLLAGYELRR